ncbi:hypothetical protein PUR59_35720 [Streptomyces sp. SP18ES09]|uniref:8-oxoguanine DNA glycosylase OGG fold protein n=1 Tax=unclassified Streptomyces TaxID=2593676 RepID=UPI002E7918CB|nr:hypothetical protein [Streptomyces sp. SP18ES09]MEE1820348.1 hypothetical protein [Streptomyces sp. SP18ES09]
MSRQDRADALDAELTTRPLPPAAVSVLGEWLAGTGAPYARGTGAHAVSFAPERWSNVPSWPATAVPAAGPLSRARVTDAVREAVRDGRWAEALAVPYAWGHGGTGYGPHRLRKILAAPHAPRALAEAASVLGEDGPVEAYRVLRGAVKGLGPAFFTKFLYFVDQAADAPATPRASAAPRALVLDRKVARVVRAHATRVGREARLPGAAGTAAWIWSDGGWTEHRYAVYLRWVAHASGQLASAGIGWPEDSPDLLELALFSDIWDPAR